MISHVQNSREYCNAASIVIHLVAGSLFFNNHNRDLVMARTGKKKLSSGAKKKKTVVRKSAASKKKKVAAKKKITRAKKATRKKKTAVANEQLPSKKKTAAKRSAKKKVTVKKAGKRSQQTAESTTASRGRQRGNREAERAATESKRNSAPGREASNDETSGNSAPDIMTASMQQWTDYWFSAADNTMNMSRLGADIGMQLLKNASRPVANPDPLNLGELFVGAGQRMQLDPTAVFTANSKLLQKQAELWSYAVEKAHGNTPDPVVSAEHGDRRFKSEAWSEELVFDVLKQNYLLLSSWMLDLIQTGAEEINEKERARLVFMTRQMIDAMAPTNFASTNPDVLAKTIDSYGENLSSGLANMRRDLANGTLNIRQVNPDAFSVGRDIAVTEGAVVFENELIQLIQYSPLTKQVNEVPLLIVPPWINKFYILDLKPENSFIRWAVEQGLTVFVISWRNVDSSMRETTFDDYLTKGVVEAVSAVEKATGQPAVNAIGYCIGGTLLATVLAWMKARDDTRIRSATFFTTQVDFSEPGELGHFIDETQISAIEDVMQKNGYLDGAEMARTFNMLRSNDLIWSFWINNYLLGKDTLDFDLLYWNADSTRIPQHTHSFYLRQMYLENNLVKPGAVTLAGEQLHLDRVDLPIYLQATRDDHIAPWRSVIKAKQHFSGDVRFVLAGSGHIAGVVNPPAKQKYCYWINESEPMEAGAWDEGASEYSGSWWPDWIEWIKPMSGDLIAARQPGDGGLKVLEAAPGSYVLE